MNAFRVLGVAPSATRMEVERAGQRILAQLEIGAASVKFLPGTRTPRTVEHVRDALNALRDPEQRLLAEIEVQAVPFDLGPPAGVDLWHGLNTGLTRPWPQE